MDGINIWLLIAIVLIAISIYFAVKRSDTGILNWIGWAICALLMRGVGIGAVALIIMAATSSNAAYICDKHEAVQKALLTKFKETVRVRGISGNGNSRMVVELFSSPEGTFTIIATEPGGRACVTAAGVAVEYYNAEIEGQDT